MQKNFWGWFWVEVVHLTVTSVLGELESAINWYLSGAKPKKAYHFCKTKTWHAVVAS